MEELISNDTLSASSFFNTKRKPQIELCISTNYVVSRTNSFNLLSNNSFFADKETKSNSLEIFKEFVDQRLMYLDSLNNLGNGWISGDSYQPNKAVIEKAKNILKDILLFCQMKKQQNVFLLPKIIMGPIPSGGISYEFINSYNKVFLNIFNTGESDMEFCNDNDGYYEDIDLNNVSLSDMVINHLFQNTISHDYSEWGKTI